MSSVIRLLAFVVVVAGACFCAGAASSEPDLLKLASKIMRTPTRADNAAGSEIAINHPWLSDHQLLHIKDHALWLYDTDSKTDTKLERLTKVVMGGQGYLMVEASPNGKYIAWDHSGSPWHTSDITGDHWKQWPSTPVSFCYWCQDGKHWVRYDAATSSYAELRWERAVLYDAGNPQAKPAVFALPAALRPLFPVAMPSIATIIAQQPDKIQNIRRKTVNNHLVFTYQDIPQSVQHISVWDLPSGKQIAAWTIQLPNPPYDVAASPDGKKLAWLIPLHTENEGYWSSSIWVSNVDGTNLHEIGEVDKSVPWRFGYIFEISWLPSGKAISFRSPSWLYTVPAP